jgi:hypothetical protein
MMTSSAMFYRCGKSKKKSTATATVGGTVTSGKF